MAVHAAHGCTCCTWLHTHHTAVHTAHGCTRLYARHTAAGAAQAAGSAPSCASLSAEAMQSGSACAHRELGKVNWLSLPGFLVILQGVWAFPTQLSREFAVPYPTETPGPVADGPVHSLKNAPGGESTECGGAAGDPEEAPTAGAGVAPRDPERAWASGRGAGQRCGTSPKLLGSAGWLH